VLEPLVGVAHRPLRVGQVIDSATSIASSSDSDDSR
jgi:hypothetical protein